MEAATAAPSLAARVRAERFEHECERLRRLGEAYVLRRFSGALNRADAEDVVAEVLVRLHRMSAAGRPPRNLRATFFSSVRNQAIDQLRSRASRPTVGLEAAGEAQAPEPTPSEWAESREDSARVQDALGRMRGNYREAIMLRFGLGLTVPEIAAHCQISLPAAKKLVMRATAQARKRMQAVEDCDFCPEMRALARHAVLDKELSGLGEEGELALLRAHLSHCGSCKSFVAGLHDHLHDLGAAAVFGLLGSEHLSGHLGVLDALGHWGSAALDGVQAGGGRVRHLAYKLSGALSSSDGSPAGALMSTSQKIAALCTAGAATTATCLVTGAIGPGITTPVGAPAEPVRPAAQVREEPAPEPTTVPEAPAAPTPTPTEADPASSGAKSTEAPPAPAPSRAVQTPEQTASAPPQPSEPPRPEYGAIPGTPASSPTPEPAPSAVAPSTARPTVGSGASGTAPEPSVPSGGGSTGSGVGFHG